MTGWPLDQLDPVAVGVGEPGDLRAVGTSRTLLRTRLQALLLEAFERGSERVDLDYEVAEAEPTSTERSVTRYAVWRVFTRSRLLDGSRLPSR
jgi:hypothetical protein